MLQCTLCTVLYCTVKYAIICTLMSDVVLFDYVSSALLRSVHLFLFYLYHHVIGLFRLVFELFYLFDLNAF